MEYIARLGEIVHEAAAPALLICTVLGLINCFFGLRLLKMWVSMIGFGIGMTGGYMLGMHFGNTIAIAVICALIGGILLATLAYCIYRWGIFLLCFLMGTAVCYLLIHPTSSGSFFVCLMAGAGVGALALKFVEPVIIISTSLQGGFMAGTCIGNLLHAREKGMGYALGVLFAILGILIQWLGWRRRLREEEMEENTFQEDGIDDTIEER